MSEGEFKKRIVEFQTLEGHKKYYERNPEKYHYGITNEDFTKEIMDWIDEAKKEFPIIFLREVIFNKFKRYNLHVESIEKFKGNLTKNRANAHINENKVIGWFLKWFGDAK